MKRFLIVLVVACLLTGGEAGKGLLKKCREKNKELKQAADTLTEAKEGLSKKAAALEAELNTLKAQLDTLKEANAKLSEAKEALNRQVDSLTEEKADLLELIRVTVGEDMLAFYPLNEKYGGRDVLNLAKSLELKQVTFDDDSQQWKSPPAHFAGTEESFGVDMDDSRLSTSGSFSVMASVYPEHSNQGPIMEIDYGNAFGHNGPVLWFIQHKELKTYYFYGGAEFPTCRRQALRTDDVYHAGVVQDKWFDVAMVYNHEAKTVTIWVDGKQKESKVECTEKANHKGASPLRLTIGKRSWRTDSRHFKGRVTCVRLYNKAMTLEEMEASTRFCRKDEE